MARRKLMINDTELLKMRDAGMTNMDIANSLGVSNQTIRAHIGNQPWKNWYGYKRRMRQPESIVNPVAAMAEPEQEAVLVLTNQIKYLTGEAAEWCVNPKDRVVMFKTCDADAVTIGFDDYGLFAKEVAAIARHIKDQHITPEMW